MDVDSTAAAAHRGAGGVTVWASEVHARFLVPFLDELDALLGAYGTEELLSRWGVTAAELRDTTAWVSLRFAEALVEEAVRLSGSPELVERCGRAVTQRRYLGALYPVLRILGSPRRFFAMLPSLTQRFNKVSRIVVHELRANRMVIAYGSDPEHRERSPLVCTARRAQLAAIPTVWDLPAARVHELQCQMDGHDACVYEISWHNRTAMHGMIAGLIVGAAAAVTAFGLVPSALAAAALLALGAAAGLIWDQRRALRESRDCAEEQQEALTALLAATEQRFEVAVEQTRRRELAERDRLKMEAKLRLSERMASVGLLASGVAHEINNPLAYVMANLEFLDAELDRLFAGKRESDEVEQLRAAISDAQRGARRVERIVRELRLFAHIDDADPRPVDVAQAMETAVSMATAVVKGRARIVRDYHPARPARAHAGRLGQVFLNLVVNAAQAMRDGDGRDNDKRIYLRIRDHGGPSVVVEVADNGPGIPKELQERIFEPFFTTKNQGEGMGLGLYICHSIVQAAGGSLHVESREGAGATFRVVLPAWEDTGSVQGEEDRAAGAASHRSRQVERVLSETRAEPSGAARRARKR